MGSQLALSGQRVALVDSMHIRAIAHPVNSAYHDPTLNKVDVLPSITPSSRTSSAKSSYKRKVSLNLGLPLPLGSHSKNYAPSNSLTPREVNGIKQEDGPVLAKDLLRFSSAPESKQHIDTYEYLSESGDSEDESQPSKETEIKQFLEDTSSGHVLPNSTKTGKDCFLFAC